MQRVCLSFLWLCVLLPACVTTNATMLGTARARMALSPESVAIYRTAAQVPGQYEEVALLYSKGPASWTNEPTMFESMKQKAASLGANAIILDAISEPSAGAKIAGAFLGYEAERQGNAIAIYVHYGAASQIVTPLVIPPPVAAVQPAVAPAAIIVPVGESIPVPASPAPVSAPTASQPAVYNDTSTVDTQLRNAEREFRAGRMSLEEFREIKRVLQGQ